MKKHRIVKDLFSVFGVQMLVMFGWILMLMAILALCIMLDVDHDSLLVAALGTGLISFLLYRSLKKRYSFEVSPFSFAGLRRCWVPIALAAGGYLLRCVLGMFAGGTLSVEMNTGSLAGFLLFGMAYTLMNGLLFYAYSVWYLTRRNYSERDIAGMVVMVHLMYALLDVLLSFPEYLYLPGAHVPALLTALTIVGESALMTLLFIRTGSLWGGMLVTWMNLELTLVVEEYTPALIAVEVGYLMIVYMASYILLRQKDKAKTA